MPQGTITEEDRKFVETWENISRQGNAIIRLDSRGNETQELITNRRRFFITTEERMIMQDRIRDPKNDPFLNGCFRPVLVPESVSISSNPNAISDDEIRSLFVSSDLAWAEWMKIIDSPETLRRMLELTDEAGDLPLKRYRELATRLAEVKPVTRIVQKDQAQYDALAGANAAPGAAPPHTPPPPRGQGGRSADYRSS